jgi:hypothetical protein
MDLPPRCTVRRHSRALPLAWLALALLARGALAQDEWEPTEAITLSCDHTAHERFGFERVAIDTLPFSRNQPAGIKVFENREGTDTARFAVLPGQIAECRFMGVTVRLKVGAYPGRAYGMCGADGEVFASVWIDRRKLVSREWMTGHCKQDFGGPKVSFRLSNLVGLSRGVKFEKCASAYPVGGAAPDTAAAEPAVCVDYPDVASYPVDEIEYPPEGATAAAVGAIEIASGTDSVCAAAQSEWIATDAWYRSSGAGTRPTLLDSEMQWRPAALALPDSMARAEESVLDFDNDGALDRVWRREFSNNYMDGRILLVQAGSSSEEPPPATDPDDSFKLYPCQMSGVASFRACPPFSQQNDEAGFDVPAEPGPVYFRGRYTALDPFRFEGTTFVRAVRHSQELADFRAVLRPGAGGQFTPVCLLRRVTENF